MHHDDLPQPDNPQLRVACIAGQLSLLDTSRDWTISVDFLSSASTQRRRSIRRRDHPLARAVGRKQPLPDILDGTAGLGRDAFVLATLGYRVTAVERSPVLHALLADGLARLLADPAGAAIVADRLQVLPGDFRELLAHGAAPRVIYLDPMFPNRPKSAKVKKEMQLLHDLLGQDLDAIELLHAAQQAATDRVVVKRPVWAEPLIQPPDYTVEGSKVRWDVYLSNRRARICSSKACG